MTSLSPQFATVLADYDGHARWVTTLNNYDTGNKPVDVLVTLFSDGTMHLATRPTHEPSCTWSPPAIAERV